jgi:DNA-binding response OmpR family regulator
MKNSVPQTPSEPSRILVVEDDRALLTGLAMNLRMEGYDVLEASDGETGMRLAFDAHPDLIVLDIGMPGWSGLEILEELRSRTQHVPVLILSARRTTNDKVQALDIGADDYMTKPFDLPELIARIRAMLRRQQTDAADLPPLVLGELKLDRAARTAWVRGRELSLSTREFDLLRLFAESPGKVFTRDAILERIWGWDYEGTARTVDNFVAGLRKELKKHAPLCIAIQTVPRYGYKLTAPQ